MIFVHLPELHRKKIVSIHRISVPSSYIDESYTLEFKLLHFLKNLEFKRQYYKYKSGIRCHEADFCQLGILITFWNPVENYSVNSLEVVPIQQR